MSNGLSFDEKPDRLSELLGDSSTNNRLDIWLWLYLYLHEDLPLEHNTCNGHSMREALARTLSRRRDLLGIIPSRKDEYLLPDERLNWITYDERQHQWLRPRVNDLCGKDFPEDLVHLTGRNQVIAMLDVWPEEISRKAQLIEELHDCWRRHVARDSQFEWFRDKKEGGRRCLCAWEWLETHHLSEFPRQLPISNYQELLMFFDAANLRSYEQKVMIQEIKKRWNRQQFDERNADKKQVNVMLSKTVIAQLDALAETHGLKRAQVIESLVRMEADAGMYLANT